MKKSLVALAVLAASGAAMAQSSVTLYGIADIWLGSVDIEDNGSGVAAAVGFANGSTTRLQSGGVQSTRWGMKGTEDLGGGLKANFQFEQGFALDSGVGANFRRQAWVGFSGGFGEVRLGNTGTAFDDVAGASNAVFDSDLAPINGADDFGTTKVASGNAAGVFNTGAYTSKPGNQIYYKSPNMGGFTGTVSYALDEDVNNEVVAFNVAYSGGPVGAQLMYQKEEKPSGADTAFMRLGASYNFGVATAKFIYGSVDNTAFVDGAKTTEWQIGADYPMAANMILSGSYAASDDNDTAGDTKRSGFGVAVAYLMSKRTTLYGGFKKVTYDFTGSTADLDVTVFAAGVRHTF
jgi:predicted porin